MPKITRKRQVTIPKANADLAAKLKLFDESVARRRKRDAARGPVPTPEDRGWTRDELYVRGRSW
jgi:hypothetical protein